MPSLEVELDTIGFRVASEHGFQPWIYYKGGFIVGVTNAVIVYRIFLNILLFLIQDTLKIPCGRNFQLISALDRPPLDP
eukprot:5713970-Pyramimonas_sp.AAC.2